MPANFRDLTENDAAITDALKKITLTATGTYSVDDSTLTQSKYDFTSRVFPGDLANEDQGHYMVININVPVQASGGSRTSLTGVPGTGSVLSSEFSKVDTLRFGNVPNAGGQSREFFSVPRFTRRIAESIALHMPSQIIYTSQNDYEDVSLTSLGGKLLTGSLNAIGRGFSNIPGVGGTLGQAATSIVSAAGQAIPTAARIAGYPINPRVEVLFSTTYQRQFMFEVLMAPRNERESQAIEEIVKTIRFHAAPEIDSATYGLTWIPPAEFDITFFNRGKENTHLPRINTCVLERCDVDYAPLNGVYSTFRNGYPVGVRLSMGFREVEVVHKLRVLQGF